MGQLPKLAFCDNFEEMSLLETNSGTITVSTLESGGGPANSVQFFTGANGYAGGLYFYIRATAIDILYESSLLL